MANQILRFDVTKQRELQIPQTVIGRVGDGGLKAVTLYLEGDGMPYNLTGINAVLEVYKPDGHHFVDASCSTVLDPQGGILRMKFDKEVFTAQGKCQQAFIKLERGDLVDSTLEFDIEVLPNKVEFGINSRSYISEYERLVKDLKEIYANTIAELQAQIGTMAQEIKELEDSLAANDFVKKEDYDVKMLEIDTKLSNAVYIGQEQEGEA